MSRSRNDLHTDPNPETPLRKWNPVMTRLPIQPERLPILTCQSRKSGRTTAIRKREGKQSRSSSQQQISISQQLGQQKELLDSLISRNQQSCIDQE